MEVHSGRRSVRKQANLQKEGSWDSQEISLVRVGACREVVGWIISKVMRGRTKL